MSPEIALAPQNHGDSCQGGSVTQVDIFLLQRAPTFLIIPSA